jgi:hypothetical protein
VFDEGLAAAGVDADCAVEISCCWVVSCGLEVWMNLSIV